MLKTEIKYNRPRPKIEYNRPRPKIKYNRPRPKIDRKASRANLFYFWILTDPKPLKRYEDDYLSELGRYLRSEEPY